MVRYAWITPSVWKGVDPQTAGEYIDSLADQDGFVDRDAVVEAASDPRSPLHPCFEWNDEKAAVNYRHRQAKSLVQNLVLKKRNRQTKTKAFVFVNPEKHAKRAIMSIERAMKLPSMREQVLQQAYRELSRWVARYEGYAELTDAREAIIRAVESQIVSDIKIAV
jgi:hypothetical protein